MFLILRKSETRVLRKKMFLKEKSLLSTRIYCQQLWKKNKWLKKEASSDDNSIMPLPPDLLILLNWRKIKDRARQDSNPESSDPKSDALSIAPWDASYLVRQCFVYNCNLLIMFAASGAIGPRALDARGLRFESLKDYIFYSLC